MHVQTDVTWHLYLKIPAEREGKVNTCSDFGDTFQQEKNADNYLLKKFCNHCENNGWLGHGPGVEQVYFEPWTTEKKYLKIMKMFATTVVLSKEDFLAFQRRSQVSRKWGKFSYSCECNGTVNIKQVKENTYTLF